MQIKNGINGNRQNAHVVLDAKSDGTLGKMTFQTDGVDGLVLDNNTLTVSTGGEERLKVEAAGSIVQTADMVSNGIGIKQTLEAEDGSVSNMFGNYVAFSSQQTGGLHDGGWIGYYVHTVSATQSVKDVRGLVSVTQSVKDVRGFGVNDQGNAIVSASAFHSAINARAGKERYAVNAVGSAPSYFGGEIQTARIVGSAAPATDASIELGANVTINSADQVPLQIRSTADNCYVQLKDNSNPAAHFGFYNDDIVVSAGVGGAVQLTITPNEAVKVPTQLQTGKITSLAGASNDASIELGRHFEMTTEKGGYTAYSLGGHVFQSDGSQSRFSNEGDFLVGTGTAFTGDGSVDATKTVVLSEGKKGIARWSARETSSSPPVDLFLSCDYGSNEIVFNASAEVLLKDTDGNNYTPTQPNSIATRGWVESVVGSGGSVNPDTVPGTGAGASWEEQSVDVSNVESNQQAYAALYSYDGIFTDGLHWTSDGYQWNTSDPSLRSGTLGSYTGRDDGKVVKGNGNEYITSRHVSSDMKSWRQINTYSDKPFYLDGEFYAENGSKKFNRTNTSWDSHASFGGTLSAGTPKNVASMESGLFVLAIQTDGSVHWSVGLDGPSAWQQSGISGAKCCTFIERMGKWLVIGESEFWLSDNASLGAVNWTNAALPTAANWDRVVDDGGTISITSTAANFNLVLYCTEENGPSVEGDWKTTVNYNNRGYEGFTGTNGRTIGSMRSEVEGDTRKYYYSVGGDIRVEGKMDTRHVELTNPVSIASARAIEAQTQEDANAVFTEEIQRRSPVMTLTQVEYDAIPADEIEDDTLYLITS